MVATNLSSMTYNSNGMLSGYSNGGLAWTASTATSTATSTTASLSTGVGAGTTWQRLESDDFGGCRCCLDSGSRPSSVVASPLRSAIFTSQLRRRSGGHSLSLSEVS